MTHTLAQIVGHDMDNTKFSETIQKARRDAEMGKFDSALLSLERLQQSLDASDFGAISKITAAIGSVTAKQKSCEALITKLASQIKRKLWSEAHSTCAKILAIATRHDTAVQSKKQIELELLAVGVDPHNSGSDTQNFDAQSTIDRSGSLGESVLTGQPVTEGSEVRGLSSVHSLPGDSSKAGDSSAAGDVSPDSLATTQHLRRDSLAESVRLAPSQQYAVGQQLTSELPVLWIDGVGGYTLCDRDESILGQAAPGSDASLRLQGDLSRRAVSFRRGDGSHLIQPLQATRLNGQELDRAAILASGDAIQIGSRVQLTYSKPNRLSTTARIDVVSNHRWQPFVEAVLLLGNNFIVGPKANAHVRCDFSSADIVFFRRQSQWWCRCETGLEIDAQPTDQPIQLTRHQRVRAGEVTFVLD